MVMANKQTAAQIRVITPLQKPAYYDGLLNTVKALGHVEEIPFAEMEKAFCAQSTDAVVFPESDGVPFYAADAIHRYMQEGGKLLTLGGPPLSRVLFPENGAWKPRAELTTNEGRCQGRHMVWTFDDPTFAEGWGRNAMKPEHPVNIEIGDFGSPDSDTALHVHISEFHGWDSIIKRVEMPGDYKYFGLYKKGGPHTHSMTIQLREADGSLWIAQVGLREEWEYSRLAIGDFHYWFDNPSKGRGGPGDHVHFDNVVDMAIGMSVSHCNTQGGIDQEFWVDSLHLCNDEVPVHDGLSPEYKYYPIENGNVAKAGENQVFVKARDYALPESLFSCHIRGQGTGYNHGREARFVPLIEVFDEKSLYSGCLAWMFVTSSAEAFIEENIYESGIIAGFGTSDPAFYNEDGLAAVSDTLKAMLGDVMLVEGGTSEYLYVEAETEEIPYGLHVRGRDLTNVTAEVSLFAGDACLKTSQFAIGGGVQKKAGVWVAGAEDTYALKNGNPDAVTVTLFKDGEPIDRISHEIVIWSPKPESERRYITRENHEFMRDGKPLRAFGVSYMTTYNLAFDSKQGGHNWEQYVDLSAYDPDVCRRDMKRILDVGFNAVALYVYIKVSNASRNIMHLLDMCDKMGLVVDFALRPYFPLEHDKADTSIQDIIVRQHLAEMDHIIGYDIAWEQCVGRYIGSYGSVPGGRRMFDPMWVRWVEDVYGSVEHAEQVWKHPMPKTPEGAYTCPSDGMVEAPGEHRALVAAYRRFIDDFVSEKHGYFRDMIHEVDQNHAVSARTNYSGIPKFQPGAMAYDFQSLATVFDYMSPEYYGRMEEIYTCSFTNVYARYARPGAPVVWKEFAISCWRGSNFVYDERRYELWRNQAKFAEEMYKMAISGHTGAMYYWFFPGGFRPWENSDLGVINPDGSDRMVTKVVRAMREPFLNQPLLPEPDVIFTVERDEHPSAICGIYQQVEKEYHEAERAGKTVALRDAAFGTTTATVPDTAIGGGTAAADNPARYVNGEFRHIFGKAADGTWQRLSYGDTLCVNGPVEIRAMMSNPLPSQWLSAPEEAYVSLVSTEKSDVAVHLPLAEPVGHLQTLTQEFTLCERPETEKTVALRFGIEGRFPFGAPFAFTVKPV